MDTYNDDDDEIPIESVIKNKIKMITRLREC